ncbi:MAG: hypothetical protein H6595_11295 [Flavobacteriales bacterium]|nr:hypothetical protein [Flavobacteriales bacterium]MCB9168045.1 hypothetical protein [Flavobacteriales bacterium]
MRASIHISALVLPHLLYLSGAAQTTGTLRLLIDPGHNFTFVVDHQYRMQQREVTLTEGPHHFAFWAPGRMVVDTTLEVVPGRTIEYLLHLPESPAYRTYVQEYQAWRTRKRWVNAAPLVATLGGVAWSTVAFLNMRRAYQDLKDDQDHYTHGNVPSDVMMLKEGTIPAHEDALSRRRTMFGIAAGTTVLAAGATYLVHRMTRKWQAPVFDDREKLKFDGLTWWPQGADGVWCLRFTIPLQ